MLKCLAALPPALALAGQAAWAEATPGGAADLTATLQSYLGSTPGVVTVAPEGASYRVRLDAGPLLARLPSEAQAAVSVSPLDLVLTDNGNGTWAVAQDQPLSFTMRLAGGTDMALSIGRLACTGTYDTALRAFAAQDCTMSDLRMDQTQVDPAMGEIKVAYSMAAGSYRLASTAGAQGGVDSTSSYVMTGLEQTMTIPGAAGMPGTPIRMTAAEYTLSGTGTGFRNDAILSLVAWFVAHPDAVLTEASRAELKGIVAAALPLFDRIAADGTVTQVGVETPYGPVGIERIGVGLELRGAVAEGLFREAIAFEGLSLPPGVVPDFAAGLVPERFSIDIALDSFDAAAAAQVVLGLFDLPMGTEPPAELGDRILSALLPDGTLRIRLAPGEIANATYSLTYEGSMTAGPEAMAAGTGRVTARGYDAAVAMLDRAPPEMTSDALMLMGMARGLARDRGDGTLVWEIDASQPGTFKVNGMDLMRLQ